MEKDWTRLKTLGELKMAGYRPRTVKEELRDNLARALREGRSVFEGIIGYEDTVIPEVERAVLSGHNILLLGLRGQAKTRIARQLTNLLDPFVPVIAGSEINDDPFNPVSAYGRNLLADMGDSTPVDWLPREMRYGEKLATPDVTVADLIGDIDPIKAASQKLSYSDERVIHYGIIPRSNRGIFAINELPDLQARIQVALFNILQEGDIQIRGFRVRLPLDVQFVFTANPEDYTSRGSIVTPLKDRIESQILTHYPLNAGISRAITLQEARIPEGVREAVHVPELAQWLLEEVAMEARRSEYVDQKSGVSARLTISAFENLISSAERRRLKAGLPKTSVRLSDFWSIVPSVTGKVELVYEGEQEGPLMVAQTLLSKAIRNLFAERYPIPGKRKKTSTHAAVYEPVVHWFAEGNQVEFPVDQDNEGHTGALDAVPGLKALAKSARVGVKAEDLAFEMEFCLHGMAAYSLIGKEVHGHTLRFADLMHSMFPAGDEEE